MFSSKDIRENFVIKTYWSPKTTTSKNAFLAVCLFDVNSRASFGGEIGAGDNLLHNYLKFSKILRMHAIFHDAYGYMRSNNNVGPGYVYTLTSEKYFKNSMLLGQFSGISFWRFMKFSKPDYFDNFPL